jgi:FKBP-type peptidyl-prolyl cis-trans isomerase SlpA
MSNEQPVVTASSYLTLNYRLASLDGTDIVTTFNQPATLLMGQGQLAPVLEELLLGLPEGTHRPSIWSRASASARATRS